MAIDRSKLQRMYNLMADNGYTQDYNTFEKKFTGDSNYANRKAVYDLFTNNGADLGGSYEEFMRKLQKPRATKPQQQPKTALGRAQQSVAQQKWGGYGGAVAPMENDSELVRGLKNADAAQRLQTPVSYAKPGAVKQMVKQTRERQHVVGQNVEQAGRQSTNRERDRRNAPAFDLGNEDVNNNIVKTRGQLEKDMEKSGSKFVDDEFSKYIGDVFKKEDEAAFERGQNAALNVIASSPSNAVFGTTRARNEEMSPEKRLANITKEIEGNIHNLFSSSNVAERINAEATKLGVSPDDYVEHTLVPSLMNKVSSDFDKTELKNLLPSGAIETILMHAQNSMTGALASMGLMTKSQRQYGQRALSETLEGNNPNYKPGMGTKVAGSTLSFMMDMTPIGMAEKPAAALTWKVFGNGVAQAARIANSTLGGRIARMAGSGMVSQGVTGVLYCSTNAAVQNYSTGDDTSIGNTVKMMAMGGLSEGASWATMGGIGGVVGAGIYNVSGVKRIPAKAFQLAMEGIGMHIGGNVAKTIEGHDTDWTSIEGNLEACANVVALKLTHARLPKRQSKDGIKESYLDMVARNINGLMTSDGQRAAFGGYTFTNEEKEQLFGSASAPKRNESIYGYDAHNNPLTRKESLTSWAMRAKKTAAKGKGEKDTDAEFVKTAYDEIMADNTIPWDTKAKFSALVMGTVPSARPMMEYIRIEDGSVNEYSKNGELLSKNSFKTSDERDSILYSLNQKSEDQRLNNAYGAAQIKDEKAAQETLETVAKTFGLTAEEMKAVMDKDPLRRSDEEQNACVALRKAYEDEQFVPGTLHAEQSNTEGKDVVEENGLGTETPNNEAASEVLGDLTKAEDALQAAMDSNDVLKEEYERMQKAGMSNPQIYMELFNAGLTQEQLAPLADYINALSKAQGMFKGTQDKIVETTQKHVGQWSYKGELNGEKQNGEQMVFVKDNKGRVLIVGAGDVTFDGEGRVRDGDMLTVYDPATREMDFVHAKDVTLEHTATSEEYAKDYQRQLEELNSTVYAEMQQQDGKPNEASLSQTKPGEQPVGEEGNEALLGLTKPTKPVGEEPVATLADGTPVPMTKDSKGRETADYSQMTPEQGAEWIKTRFGENADGFVDGRIKRAEKAVKAAEKMKVDFSGEEEDVAEALASRKAAIESAEKELNYFTAVKNVMKQTKAAESAAGGEGATGNRYEQWRKDGYHIGEGGVRYDRQKKEDMTGVYGKDVKVDFTPTVGVNGRAKVVEVDSVQASHVNGQVNPMHFGPDWQPKDRTDIASKTGQDKALANFDPEKITGDGNAFIGSSPSVNERHEAIQGNNRVEILRRLYDEQPEKAAQHKQWLIDHAEEYGLDAAEIAKMKKPILVNELPVDDAKALELGQYRASDFESGGKELPRTSVVINRLGDKMQNVANIMLRQGTLPEDAKMSDLVSQNATKVLDYLVKEGVVSATEEQTLRKDSTAMRQWMGELLKTGLFEGDKETEAAFNQLPDNARRAVLATYLRDAKSGDAAKIKQNLQRSFEAYSRMMNNPAFVNAKNVEEARAAVSAEIEKGNNSLFGEEPVRELFSNFELELAVLYKGLKDQKTLTGLLNKYFDAVQGDKVSNRQLEIGEEPREAISKEEALKEVFGLHESKPAETQRQVDKAIKIVATEITKKTGIEVVTDEKEAEEVLEKSENAIRENRSRWAGGEVVGMKQLPDKLHTDPDMLWSEISQYHGDYITRKLEKVPEDGTVKFFSAHDGKWYFYSVDKNHTITLFDAVEASRENYELFKDKLKKYGFDSTTRTGRDGLQEAGYTGRTDGDKFESFIRPGIERSNGLGDGKAQGGRRADRRGMAGEADGTQLEGDSEKQGEVKYFRTANGEVYGFTDGEKIYLDTKKMKPETPLHEYAHLWCDMLRRVNPKEWENVKKLFDEVDGLKDEVQKLYPELEGDALYEEMITTYSGREGTKKLEDVVRKLAAEEGKSVTESAKAQGFLAKVKEALTKYWKGVADVLGIHFTTAEEVADKVLADWAKGVNPLESEEGRVKSEESNTVGAEPHDASLSLTEPLGKKEHAKTLDEGASAPVGEEPSKTNPLAWLAHTAEMFKDEQIEKARAEFAEAKKSGDASEVKRLTDKLKGLMDAKLRGNGIGLVERRRIIGREIGKILGEEAGKAEAEKIDKPWADMEFDEQVAETEKKPLDADEIKNSDCDGVDKANAVAYLNGDKNIINTLSYLTVYDNVRNRERDSVPSSGTEDGTQLDTADNAGGEGLGRTDSRPQGVDSGQLGGNEGDGNPERGESVQPGERVSGGESGEVHATTAVGEQGGEQVHGGASGVEPVSAGGAKPRGSRGVRGTGRDVRERGNEGSGNISNEKAGEATGGRGIDSRNLSTVEQIDKEISDTQSLVDDLFNSLFDGRTKGSIISDRTNASIIPLASDHLLGKLGINKQKMAVYKQLIPALTKLGYLHIKKGVVKLNDWIDAMKGSFGGHLTKLGLSDEEVYDYIKNMWNSNIEVDGVTHKLSEWASILGTERMKKEIATPNAEKYKRQVAAEPIKVKVGDMKNIEETLPFLLPQQQEDVLRAETQFFGNEHADREHAYGKGYMFTNGTGTGKTYTGLGIAKRLVKQGKGRILIVTPSQKKVSDWIKDGRNLNMEIRDLDSIAKERGTTATTESGEGVVITTFANFGLNKKLLETKWDAVIYDESHRIMENKKGAETARSMQHYMVTNRDESRCFLRLQETNKDYQKMKSLGEQFDAERDKEVERIRKEYKASHPSATNRDVNYATSRMMPKEIQSFTPGDYASFPKLGKIHGEYMKAFSHYVNEVKPKLEAQAKEEWKDTKTIFLSATPFNTRENLDYVEGYIFKYPEGEKAGRMSGRTQFYLDHFGAAYKFRYNRLEQSTSNPEAVAKQEIEFSDYLQHTLGTMSGRIIDSPYDYSRDFPTVSPDHAETFNQAVQEAVRGHEVLAKAYNQTIGDYNYGSALFETMKVANIIERIKAHLDAGRKVVIFHRRVETKEPLKPPFASMLEQANRLIAMMKPGEEQKKAIKAVSEYRKKYADLLEWEQTLDYSMPREQIAKVFGKDNVLFFSGKESSKVKDKAVDTFNDDNSGKNIIVIQEASGKEGISLHDTTGKHQRVCITLALPQSPITALQIEGRTYRIGNKSNAIFEYPILGLNSEMMLFGQKFNNQVSTTENLALGSKARSLRDSFANGILEHSGVVPIDQQGVGGKEFDAPKDQSTDGFDNAVLDYYSNQKLNSRNREGVDYFPTPEPLGYKMMEWANMGEGDTVLEPSAGHGAIARYAPKGNQMVAIEPSQSLFTKLQLKAGGLGRKFQNTIFENYDISNKHDVVVMNPPFGTAGATAIAHLGKAFKHLEEGGRVVALIPRGSTDKKFEKWIEGEKTAVMRAEVALPDIVFEQAGTKVVCRVVVVDKISNEAMRAKAGSVEKWNLGGHYDKIEDFFEDLRDVEMPDRIIDTKAIMMKKSKQTVKDLKELKDARVDFNEGGINVRVRGDWKDYSIPFDMEGYSAEQKKKFLAITYETFEQQERQTRNETSQAVLDELKKLTCKLADMTEDEMQRYLKKKYEGKGVMENIAHSAEVYNNAKKLRFQKVPKEEQSEELYLSLQNKKGKEYYDTVDILSERIADGRADIRGLSERPGRKEANRISAGIEIIAASRDRQNEAGTAKSNETKLRLGRVATEKAIEEWAKSNDAVFAEEDIAKGAMDGKPSAEGGEAVVYVSNDFSKVTKLVDPYPRNNGSIQLCMENTRLFNRLFPDAAYTVKGVARDKNGKFRIVMEQPYLEGKQYGEDTMAEYENGPSQAKDALMESLGLHDVYGDGLEFRNDKYYVSDLHPGNIVFDSEGQPHVIDADVKYYGVFRRNNIEGKPLIVDNETKETKVDTRNSEELFKSLKDKEGKEYYDTVTELAERMAGRTGRKEESVSEGQSQPRETSVGRNTERIVGRPKSVVHCAAEIIATDTRRNAGDGRESIHGSELERGQEDARLHSTSSVQSEVSTPGVWENRVSDPVEREISKRIEDWAKQTNHWLDWRNLRAKFDRNKQLGTGDEAESDVFLSKDGKTVLKIVRAPHAVYPTLLDKLNSIALQNKFFNDDAQKIIGITRIYEEGELGEKVPFVGLVMEQPFVDGKTIFDTLTENVDRAKYRKQIMESMGFKENLWVSTGGLISGWPNLVYTKDGYAFNDVNYGNVIIDRNGKPHIIDCIVDTIENAHVGLKTYKHDAEADRQAALRKIKNLEREILNEEKAIAQLRANRREDNKEQIDEFIARHEVKIADIKKQINVESGNVHYRTEPDYASLSLSKPLEGRIAETVEKVSKQTGGKVKMVNTVEEIENPKVRRDIENGKQVTGWYDEATGEVHLYMPNIHDSYTAEKTVWHETVGHKGMRGLLGDKFNDYMRGLWMDLDNPVNAELRAYVKERMAKDSMGFYDAIEEFIAESAEKGKGEPGFWNYIKNKVTDALHEIGYRISPNVKDVKYMLWLAKNVQKKGNDPWWKMRADAVKWKIEHENVEYTKIHGGEFYENDGKNHDFEDMTKEEWDEATDGQIHYRTAPSAATALDRYHKMLDAHGYMATEAFMDNMLSLDKLMRAVDPSIKKIEDVKSSMNPYILQNTMQGAMSDKMTLFEHQVMKPLDKAMSDVLDSFAGKNTEEKIRECNLYMIGKHGLERNRVLFVRDWFRKMEKTEDVDDAGLDNLDKVWKGERSDLRRKLDSGQIDLREYYRQMDEWIVQNIDKDFKAEEHDYSGMHGLQEIDDLKSPYDDAGAIDSVMSQEAKMESQKKGSVDNLWKRIKDATNYSVYSDYENGLISEELRDHVTGMFDWYVPLRKYDEATAEDIYGYISGDDGKGFIGETLMSAKGRKSLSDVNVLAQIGAMGNRAIRNGGQNAVKQAFARFVRNSGEQNLVKETKVWVEKTGTDANGNDIWEEAYPQIPDNASARDIATIVDAFETDMKTKQAKGEAKTLSNSTDIGFKFARAKNKSEHFVDVKIAGRTHRFVVMGNPRAAQALNGMLENGPAMVKWLKSTTRFMAQMATSYSPEFVMRNIIRDAEFASSNVTAKEGVMYGKKWLRYYAELNPLNVAYNEGAGALKSLKWKDLKEGVGIGLYARYREGTLGDSKMERYFKEFMQNGGETGWVQVKTMQEWEKDYKRDVSREHSKVAKTGKALRDFLVGNVENLNEVAENMARFATFCTSRDLGRSAVRSAYDAKQVSTNFNRHGSGDAIKTFKNGEMGTSKEMRRNVYGTIASYLKNYSMFFNAGVQSTHLLMNNVKKAPVGTVASMMAMPFGLGILAALANNAMIANEDEKERKGVKDPYGELPEYIRRTNLCIYKGGGEFVTIPLAIELRAFYGLGDIAAGMTAAKNVKSTRNAAMDAVGCMSQLLPVVDFMNSATFDKEPGKELLKGVLPTAAAPFMEWWLNSDWKGTPIRREGDYTKNRPAWMNAYSGTPEKLMDLNKWVNAKTNDVAPGNENMKGDDAADFITNPAMLNLIIGTLGGGAATFITRGTGLVLKYSDGREQEIETKDIPFLRSLMYTPSEQTSMARTKAKWYGYKESMEKSTSNYSLLKNKNVPLTERIRNAADRHRFEQSADYARIRIIKDAEKQMKRWNKMKRLNADDKKQVDFANKNIEMIMQKAVEQMDKVSND